MRLQEFAEPLGYLGQCDADEPVLQAFAQLLAEVFCLRDPLDQPPPVLQGIRSKDAEVEAVVPAQFSGIDLQILPRCWTYWWPALEQPVTAGGLQDAPLRPMY